MSENDKRGGELGSDTPAPVGIGVEAALCLWFALVIVTFWGPYAGFWNPALTTPLYGLFLIGAVVVSALRFLRGRDSARAVSVPAPVKKTVPNAKGGTRHDS